MRRTSPPYAVAFVTLDEGPSVLTNIVETGFDTLSVDMEVEVVFRPSPDGIVIPVFRAIQQRQA